jgi:hypothetical protein
VPGPSTYTEDEQAPAAVASRGKAVGHRVEGGWIYGLSQLRRGC